MNIVAPGYYFLAADKNTSVGRVIDVLIPKDSPSTIENQSEAIIDKKRSGKWIIAQVRHKFDADENYVVSCNLRRMSGPDPLKATETKPL